MTHLVGDTMTSEKTFQCNLLTPDGQLLDCAVSFAAIRAHDGEIAFLHNRAPLVCKLGTGEVRVETPEGARRVFIDGGFAQMLDNKLAILSEHAEAADSIDPKEAEAQLQAALELPNEEDDSRALRSAAIHRARARLKFLRKS